MKRVVVHATACLATVLFASTAMCTSLIDSLSTPRTPLLERLRNGIDAPDPFVEPTARPADGDVTLALSPKPEAAKVALLDRLRSKDGVRPEVLKLIESYQLHGKIEKSSTNVDTVKSLFDILRTNLDNKLRKHLTRHVVDRMTASPPTGTQPVPIRKGEL